MKRIITFILVSILALSFASCTSTDGSKKIVVGASSTPHAEILEIVKDSLKEQGYTLEIRVFDDYVTPNTALESGELDANYFQHTPYLNTFNKENGTHIVSVAKIHYEPLAVYGKNVSVASYAETKTGKTIIVPSDGSNCTRALFVLQDEGFITLKEDSSSSSDLSDKDIEESNGNTILLVEAALIPAQLNNANDGTLAVINGNYALAAGLKIENALATESAEGDAAQLYANIIAVKEGHEDDEKILALVKALKSQKVIDFINETYNGAVKATFTL